METILYIKRRIGYEFAQKQSLLETLAKGKTVFMEMNEDKYPQSYCDYLEVQGLNFTCKAEYVQPNLNIIYNWNGSVRRIEQPLKKFTGYLFSPIKK